MIGSVVIMRFGGKRGRMGELAPSESYARVIAASCMAITVDVCGVPIRVSPEHTRRAPKAVQP